jgi:hypothetical protein
MIHQTRPIKKTFRLLLLNYLYYSLTTLIPIGIITFIVMLIGEILIMEVKNFGSLYAFAKLFYLGVVTFFIIYILRLFDKIRIFFVLKNSSYIFHNDHIDKTIKLRFSSSTQFVKYENIQEIIISQDFIEKIYKVKNIKCKLSTSASSIIKFSYLNEKDAEELFEKLKSRVSESS